MPAIQPNETSLCPRCESTFECGMLSGGCWCKDVDLTDAVRTDLVKFYNGCLCPDCLKFLADTPAPPTVRQFLASQFKLIRANRRGASSRAAAKDENPAASEAGRILTEAERMIVSPDEQRDASADAHPGVTADGKATASEDGKPA